MDGWIDGWMDNKWEIANKTRQKEDRKRKNGRKKKSQDFLLFYGVDCVYCVFGLVAKNDTSIPVSLVT